MTIMPFIFNLSFSIIILPYPSILHISPSVLQSIPSSFSLLSNLSILSITIPFSIFIHPISYSCFTIIAFYILISLIIIPYSSSASITNALISISSYLISHYLFILLIFLSQSIDSIVLIFR